MPQLIKYLIANFVNFLRKIKVPTVTTRMTFGVSRDRGKFEWAGNSLDAIFSQRKNLLSPRMWRLLFDIIRFNKFALDILREDGTSSNGSRTPSTSLETIGHYLDRQGYSDTFRNDYLIPMTAAMWSMSPDKCALQFPVVTLVRFM
jgi:predicted NAD/FAD-binding protein